MRNELTKIAVKRNLSCRSCGNNSDYDYLSGKKGSKTVKMCGRGTYQIKREAADLKKLKWLSQKTGEKVADFVECISFRNITLFKDGRAIIKADSAEKAKADYSRYVNP